MYVPIYIHWVLLLSVMADDGDEFYCSMAARRD